MLRLPSREFARLIDHLARKDATLRFMQSSSQILDPQSSRFYAKDVNKDKNHEPSGKPLVKGEAIQRLRKRLEKFPRLTAEKKKIIDSEEMNKSYRRINLTRPFFFNWRYNRYTLYISEDQTDQSRFLVLTAFFIKKKEQSKKSWSIWLSIPAAQILLKELDVQLKNPRRTKASFDDVVRHQRIDLKKFKIQKMENHHPSQNVLDINTTDYLTNHTVGIHIPFEAISYLRNNLGNALRSYQEVLDSQEPKLAKNPNLKELCESKKSKAPPNSVIYVHLYEDMGKNKIVLMLKKFNVQTRERTKHFLDETSLKPLLELLLEAKTVVNKYRRHLPKNFQTHDVLYKKAFIENNLEWSVVVCVTRQEMSKHGAIELQIAKRLIHKRIHQKPLVLYPSAVRPFIQNYTEILHEYERYKDLNILEFKKEIDELTAQMDAELEALKETDSDDPITRRLKIHVKYEPERRRIFEKYGLEKYLRSD